MAETLVPIRCRGSGRLLGYGPADFRVYGDPVDAEVEAAGQNEERDALIEAYSRYEKINNTQLSRIFSKTHGPLSRQRIQQILLARKIR